MLAGMDPTSLLSTDAVSGNDDGGAHQHRIYGQQQQGQGGYDEVDRSSSSSSSDSSRSGSSKSSSYVTQMVGNSGDSDTRPSNALASAPAASASPSVWQPTPPPSLGVVQSWTQHPLVEHVQILFSFNSLSSTRVDYLPPLLVHFHPC
jgi:hypothetical protein